MVGRPLTHKRSPQPQVSEARSLCWLAGAYDSGVHAGPGGASVTGLQKVRPEGVVADYAATSVRSVTRVRFASIEIVHSVIKTVTWDCADALVLARFWAAALGSAVDEDSTRDKAFVEAAGWGGPNMWFNRVPEPKTAKNRLHFDLRAPGGVSDEVRRLEALGATVLRPGKMITVMRDPEGNEFCIEPGQSA